MSEFLTPVADKTVTIADTETESSAVDLGRLALVGVVFPASWDGGDLTVEVSYDEGTTWIGVTEESGGDDLTIAGPTETPPRVTPVPRESLIVGNYIRLVAASAVSADRELTIVRRRMY